jgi:hypothetical protein
MKMKGVPGHAASDREKIALDHCNEYIPSASHEMKRSVR